MPKHPVPRREPEVVKAEADRLYRGDDEKVATTSIRNLNIRGVSISSRYDKADELNLLSAVVEAMPEQAVVLIDSLWCDSKAQAYYNGTLRACSRAEAEAVAAALEHHICELSSGHNGISLDGAAGGSLHIDCNWQEGDA